MTCIRANDGVGDSDDDNHLELLLKWRHLQNKSLHGAPARDRRSGDRAHAIPWIIVWVICSLYKWPICGLYIWPIYGAYKSVFAALVIVLTQYLGVDYIWPICGLHIWPMCGLYKLPICGLYIWTMNVVYKSVIATLVIVLM